jgi:hypothetical protein
MLVLLPQSHAIVGIITVLRIHSRIRLGHFLSQMEGHPYHQRVVADEPESARLGATQRET